MTVFCTMSILMTKTKAIDSAIAIIKASTIIILFSMVTIYLVSEQAPMPGEKAG